MEWREGGYLFAIIAVSQKETMPNNAGDQTTKINIQNYRRNKNLPNL